MIEPAVRYYSEKDYPLGPPPDELYGVNEKGEPIQFLRDDRMWMSVEWAAGHGFAVPENWRELP